MSHDDKDISSERLGILQLCSQLYDRCGASIQKKINAHLKKKTEAKATFLVLLLKESDEAVIQVIGDKVLEPEMRYPIPENVLQSTIVRRRSFGGTTLDINGDLLEKLCSTVGIEPETFYCVPVLNPADDETVLIAYLMDYNTQKFTEIDCCQFVTDVFRYCLGIVLNTFAYEEEKRMKLQCENLLVVARNIFSHMDNLSNLLHQIMTEARKLTNAERCSLFLLDVEHDQLVAEIFDGPESKESPTEMRISRNQGIAGHVATTGKLLNIRDAYSHPLFYRGFDEMTGFRTRNLLCFPIHKDDAVIGVAQLCNKKNGLYFDVFDEEVAMGFSVYCGISLMHSLVYEKVKETQARNRLANELMMYHMKVASDDVSHLLNCSKSHDTEIISNFNFSFRDPPIDGLACYCFFMFKDLELDKHFNITSETLARFILLVKKGYRETSYHNFIHAACTLHFAYLLLKNLKLVERKFITELEALALMISCICHDLDHRGTTNSFQMKSDNALANLYSSEGSVMERHHFAQTVCILNSEDCYILSGIPQEDYTKCLNLIQEMILGTDLAMHIKQFHEKQEVLNKYDASNEQHRQHLLCLFMTAADLSDQTKKWTVSRTTAELVYKEFFRQGDLEKEMGTSPIEAMDREKAHIPTLQIQFLETVVIPCYEFLSKVFPETEDCVKAAIHNRDCWVTANEIFSTQWLRGGFELLSNPELQEKVDEAMSNK